MKNFYSFFFVMIAAIITTNLFSQTNTFPSSGAAGIGTTTPAASSLLEVKSTSKGVLFSRMTKTQRDAITSPATGLLIYQTNATPGFYYFDGAAWQPVSSGANTTLSNLTSPTKINVNLMPDADNKRNLGSSIKGWKNLYLDSAVYLGGSKFLAAYGGNTAVGTGTLFSNTSGNYNTANGYGALYYNTTGEQNTAIGYQALYFNTTGDYNTANGDFTLSSNTTGHENTANGSYALYSNTTGNQNTANGSYALRSNTTGYQNTANGFYALYSNTTGYNNTANGYAALSSNTAGYNNTANGYAALISNTAGYNNTANGYAALYTNTIGSYNTANGYYALLSNYEHYNTAFGAYTLSKTTASQYNIAVGYNAGGNYDNGYNNVFLGANTDVNNGNGYYNVIAIGQGTVCTDVSQVTIGNSSTATYRVYANWTNISDGRFKKNIKENVPGLEFINKLQPITYTLDATGIDNFLHKDLPQDKQTSEKAKAVMNKALAEKEKVVYTGFVAQDVEKAAKSLNYDFSGVDAAKNNKDLYGLRYAEFVVPLVKAVQELDESQKSEVKSQNEEIAKLSAGLLAEKSQNDVQQKINDDLQRQITELKAMIVSGNQQTQTNNQHVTISSPLGVGASFLFQNIPNPFNHTTTINYTLPQTYSSAKIIVTDKSGNVLKEVNLSNSSPEGGSWKGAGSLKLDTSTLSSGTYQYSLYVNGKLIDTKQMILTK